MSMAGEIACEVAADRLCAECKKNNWAHERPAVDSQGNTITWRFTAATCNKACPLASLVRYSST